MNKRDDSIDGFRIPRRTPEAARPRMGDTSMSRRGTTHTPSNTKTPEPSRSQHGVSKSELDESLQAIDGVGEEKPKKPAWWRPTRRKVKWAGIIVLAILLAVGIYLGVRAFLASNRAFDGNIFDLLSKGQPLQMDENGRSNILIFGTTEDSIAHQEEGGGEWLTDSMMLVSVDQNENKAMMTNIPRDLWVDYGEMCSNGSEGKINAAYQCGADYGENERAGAEMLKGIVGDVYGLDMHYYAHVNTSAVEQAVDAVGGVEVEIESDDPRGVYDPNFDWECNYECNYVKHPNGPAQLDGKEALLLARARDSTGMGYGLSGGNFAREQYQQKILIALRDKAVSAGTLSNPAALGKLIDSFGDNVRTNFNTREVRTVADVASEVTEERITRMQLDDEEEPLVTTSSINGQSVVVPVLGVFQYSDIHAKIQELVRPANDGEAQENEDAVVDVLNGSNIAGLAQEEATALETEGLQAGTIANAPSSPEATTLYARTGADLPNTQRLLEERYGTQMHEGIPAGIETSSDFVVIVMQAHNTL